MFCEKCGNNLGANDKFCQRCGTTVPAVNMAPQTAPVNPAVMQPVNTSLGVAEKKKKKKRISIMVLLTAILMCYSTFQPIVDFDRGILGNILSKISGNGASSTLGENQYNLYQLLLTGKIIFDDYYYILIGAVAFVVLTMVLAFVTGILNKKGLLILTGFLSIICLVGGTAYMVYTMNIVEQLNSEISSGVDSKLSFLGKYSSLIGDNLEIKNINGFGLYLFLIASGAQALFSFIGAAKK